MPEESNIITSYDLESLKTAEAFCGKAWNSLSAETIKSNREGIFFLTPEANRYYFPAYMIAAIQNFDPTDRLSDTILYSLTIQNNEEDTLKNFTRTRLNKFSQDEREVIIEFIKFLSREHPNDFLESQINAVLQSIGSVQNEATEKRSTEAQK